MKIGTVTHVLSHVLSYRMQGMDVSLGTDIQEYQRIDDSGCMLTNITGSSILKSTDHTSQVKPGKLSVRIILSDREPCSDNP